MAWQNIIYAFKNKTLIRDLNIIKYFLKCYEMFFFKILLNSINIKDKGLI